MNYCKSFICYSLSHFILSESRVNNSFNNNVENVERYVELNYFQIVHFKTFNKILSGLIIGYSICYLIVSTNALWGKTHKNICPSPDLIKPCVCDENGIICGGHSDIDLVNIFQTLEKNLTKSKRHFKTFRLNNTLNKVLKENTFKDITFDKIVIENCNQLVSIDKDAFFETNKITQILLIRNNERLSSNDNSIFKAISKFISLEHLSLEYNDIEEIPDYAFKSEIGYQDNLSFINLRGKSLKKIGVKAFSSLRNLKKLIISETSIQFFPDYIFEFNEISDVELDIFLDTLNKTYYSQFTFSDINRVTAIIASEKDVDVLERKIFSPFLNENSKNEIWLSNKSFDREDCRNQWLLNHINQVKFFKSSKFSDKNRKIHSQDNIEFIAIENYEWSNNTFIKCANKILSPCYIREQSGLDSIVCNGNIPNLKNIFHTFSDYLENGQRNFDGLFISNNAIKEISENTFSDLTFDYISISSCNKLKKIHRNAFTITNNVTTRINIQDNVLLNFEENSITEIFTKFVKLEHLTFVNIGSLKLQSFAFQPLITYQDNLKNLNFENEKIEIENFAFYNLPNLEKIRITSNEVKQLKKDTFTMKPSRKYLTLDLSDPMFVPKINNTNFQVGSLTGIDRPTRLILATSTKRNVLTYLNEKIFLPFLLDNSKNIIELVGEGLDCQDCRNIWIKNNPALLKKILNFSCADGKRIMDCDNFKNCIC